MLPEIPRDRQLGHSAPDADDPARRRTLHPLSTTNTRADPRPLSRLHRPGGHRRVGVRLVQRRRLCFHDPRNHGHVIAKGGDPKKVLAEIIGRATGYCQGRAGTFHVAAPEVGIIHTSAIVGGCLALAGGTALRRAGAKRAKRSPWSFSATAPWRKACFTRALNIAKLWQLPMIFWMENNYRRTGRGAGHAATELTNVPKALNVETTVIDGIDVGTVHKTGERYSPAACAQAKGRCSSKRAPIFGRATRSTCPSSSAASPISLGRGTPGTAPEKVRDWHKEHDPILNYLSRARRRRREPRRDRKTRRSKSVRKPMRRRASPWKARCREQRRRSTTLSPGKGN